MLHKTIPIFAADLLYRNELVAIVKGEACDLEEFILLVNQTLLTENISHLLPCNFRECNTELFHDVHTIVINS